MNPSGKGQGTQSSHSKPATHEAQPRIEATTHFSTGSKKVATAPGQATEGLRPSIDVTGPAKKKIHKRTSKECPATSYIKASMKTVAANRKVSVNLVEHNVERFRDARVNTAIASMRTILSYINSSTDAKKKLEQIGFDSGIQTSIHNIINKPYNESDVEAVAAALSKNRKEVVKIAREMDQSQKFKTSDEVSQLLKINPNSKTSEFEELIQDCAEKFSSKTIEIITKDFQKKIDKLTSQLSAQNNEIAKKANQDELDNLKTFTSQTTSNSTPETTKAINTEIAALRKEIEQLRNTPKPSDSEITGLKDNISNMKKENSTEIDTLKQRVAYLEQQLANKSTPTEIDLSLPEAQKLKIESLRQQLQDAQKAATAAEKNSENAEKKATSAEKAIAELYKEFQELQAQFSQNTAELGDAQAKLRDCEHNIGFCKDRQEQIAQDIQQKRNDHEESRQVDTLPHGESQKANDDSKRLQKKLDSMEKQRAKLAETVDRILTTHEALDEENKKLQKQQKHLNEATQKVLSLPDQDPLFIIKKTKAGELKKADHQHKAKQSNHLDAIDNLDENVEQLTNKISDLENILQNTGARDDTSQLISPDEADLEISPTIRDIAAYEANYKEASNQYGDEWDKAVTLVKKEVSLELISGADILLKALKDRNFEQVPKEPVVSVRINGQLRELSPSNPWFNALMNDENNNNYKEVINRAQEALKLKKAAVKNECSDLAKGSTKAIISSIEARLSQIKARLKKEQKDVSAWDTDITNLKSHFKQHLVLEIDDSYWKKKKKPRPADDA